MTTVKAKAKTKDPGL